MCGIAGWIGPDVGSDVLRAMTDSVRHRGPDGEGQVRLPLVGDSVAALGHRRLSIIDLSGGAQPMSSHDGRFTVVFNGEIYNYVELRSELRGKGARFRTDSDTEVIAEAWRHWGDGCLNRFRGMFAFALYDEVARTVVLARDPFGKKPLLLADGSSASGATLIFGSEVSALLAHPDVDVTLDEASLEDYLCWRYVPGPNTFFRGIRKLLPGAFVTWRDGVLVEQRYWRAPGEVPGPAAPPTDPVGEFIEIFDEAVRLRLRADVPLGAFLSSGLDSSSIVATLAQLGAPEIRTFSVGFEGDPASELPAAAATAEAVGAIHTPLELVPDDLTSLLPELSRHRGSPIAETADLPIYLMSVEASKHVKVILSGEGADELFGGYPKHVVEKHLGRLTSHSAFSAGGRAAQAVLRRLPGEHRRSTIALKALGERDHAERMVRWFGALTPAERDRVWTGPPLHRLPGQVPFRAAPTASPLVRALHFDQTSWLPDNLLERMDVMTMAASIEARNPFMDVRLAEFAGRLPDDWRVKGRTTKRIVRTALASRLPEAVVSRRKNGFRLPVSDWFRGPLKEPFADVLLDPAAITGPYIRREFVEDLAARHATGAENHEKTLWALFALETFLREFF